MGTIKQTEIKTLALISREKNTLLKLKTVLLKGYLYKLFQVMIIITAKNLMSQQKYEVI